MTLEDQFLYKLYQNGENLVKFVQKLVRPLRIVPRMHPPRRWRPTGVRRRMTGEGAEAADDALHIAVAGHLVVQIVRPLVGVMSGGMITGVRVALISHA